MVYRKENRISLTSLSPESIVILESLLRGDSVEIEDLRSSDGPLGELVDFLEENCLGWLLDQKGSHYCLAKKVKGYKALEFLGSIS